MESKNDWDEKVFQHDRIHSSAYSPSRRTLIVRFGQGRTEYEYQVPPEVWDQFKDNPHPHSFIRTKIQPNFFGRKVE